MYDKLDPQVAAMRELLSPLRTWYDQNKLSSDTLKVFTGNVVGNGTDTETRRRRKMRRLAARGRA